MTFNQTRMVTYRCSLCLQKASSDIDRGHVREWSSKASVSTQTPRRNSYLEPGSVSSQDTALFQKGESTVSKQERRGCGSAIIHSQRRTVTGPLCIPTRNASSPVSGPREVSNCFASVLILEMMSLANRTMETA
jgi:hypothetical protein